mmetsp:Transcript_22759/g.44696  ORF Transcript_22759/g.44696 Transcript_22759/m.44696 type:complete len:237 (+) Transcript_22759:131-841(+)|eukprot:CAMPEP_0171516012 /NCGR_PEP_ID=MMETSP0959-20130129/3789_1 /TAXON_ID=87120 /ORGANISM="Aurantiochytrium limacinum, Strain ATCCMYA-1381" /LENGTH=236 /DNA_ID=CAMNT_0012054653 /DNA_START=84 /DNA_END=794 /DNA_ORIENTATION=+
MVALLRVVSKTGYVRDATSQMARTGHKFRCAQLKRMSSDTGSTPDVLLLCGPSGAGKSTLSRLLLEEFPNKFGFSVSHTTRSLRNGEVDGVDYHFTTKEAMLQGIERGDFVEHVSIHGNMYGTSFKTLQAVHDEGKIVLLDVDMQGVRSIKSSPVNAKCAGIIPPSLEELESRLRGRASETEEQLQMRLKQAVVETEFCKLDDLVDTTIVNYDSWSHTYPLLRRLVTTQWFPNYFV